MRYAIKLFPRFVVKFFEILLCPVVSLMAAAVQVMARIFAVACVAIGALFLFAASAELINVGLSNESIIYFGIAVGAFLLRWLALYSIPVLCSLQAYLNDKANEPLHTNYKNYYT